MECVKHATLMPGLHVRTSALMAFFIGLQSQEGIVLQPPYIILLMPPMLLVLHALQALL